MKNLQHNLDGLTTSFRRIDESNDAIFYVQPRIVKHIDENASQAIARFLSGILPTDQPVLDLMSSAYSHFPADFESANVVGLGMNRTELAFNSMLGEFLVHDLNRNPVLPFADNTFGAVVITVSIQYLTQPVLVFQQINRILQPDRPLIIFYSNRMFPTKAVAIWHQATDRQKQDLIRLYFEQSETESSKFTPGQFQDITPVGISTENRTDGYTDPVYVFMARKMVSGLV